jgi:hypothetical protein
VTWNFLGVDTVIALHTALTEDSGGSHGSRDAGLLESAITRAENNKVNYDPDVTVATVAASLSWGCEPTSQSRDMGHPVLGFRFRDLFSHSLMYDLRPTPQALRRFQSFRRLQRE